MPPAYTILDPPLTRHGIYPNFSPTPLFSYDDIARICHWYCQHMGEVIPLPSTLSFKVIPIAWHHHGPARPTIAMISATGFAESSALSLAALETAFAQSMQQQGLEKLRQLAAGETLQWHDVVNEMLQEMGIAHVLQCQPGETLDWQEITRVREATEEVAFRSAKGE